MSEDGPVDINIPLASDASLISRLISTLFRSTRVADWDLADKFGEVYRDLVTGKISGDDIFGNPDSEG